MLCQNLRLNCPYAETSVTSPRDRPVLPRYFTRGGTGLRRPPVPARIDTLQTLPNGRGDEADYRNKKSNVKDIIQTRLRRGLPALLPAGRQA